MINENYEKRYAEACEFSDFLKRLIKANEIIRDMVNVGMVYVLTAQLSHIWALLISKTPIYKPILKNVDLFYWYFSF